MLCALAAVTLTIGLAAAFGSPLWQTNGVGVCVAVQSQFDPQIVPDGSGGAIVTWEDVRSDANYDIYAQRVNGYGNALWLTNGVTICTASNDQNDPQIVSDGARGAIVAWEDARSPATSYDIYARRADGDGNVLWQTDGVSLCVATGIQEKTQLATDGAGGAIVAWQDGRGTNKDIYARRVGSGGNAMWHTNGVTICVAAGHQEYPQIASDGAGGAFVTWQDARAGADNYGIYAQRVGSNGVTAWITDGVGVCVEENHQFGPQIVSDGAGGAIVTWYDLRSSGTTHYDIYAQRLDGDGNSLWQTDGVSLCTAFGTQLFPQIASDGAGGAIVTWQDYRSFADYDIYAQRVYSDGSVLWPTDGVSLCVASNDQDSPQIVSDGIGGAIVTWRDKRSDSLGDIYAQRVGGDGNVLWQTDGLSLCVESYHQVVPQIVSDSVWGAIVTWEDNRLSSNRDIYAQRVGVEPVHLPLVVSKYE